MRWSWAHIERKSFPRQIYQQTLLLKSCVSPMPVETTEETIPAHRMPEKSKILWRESARIQERLYTRLLVRWKTASILKECWRQETGTIGWRKSFGTGRMRLEEDDFFIWAPVAAGYARYVQKRRRSRAGTRIERWLHWKHTALMSRCLHSARE